MKDTNKICDVCGKIRKEHSRIDANNCVTKIINRRNERN